MEFLTLRKGTLVGESTQRPVHLRGLAVGGWLNTENFINGYAGNHTSWVRALREELGPERAEAFLEALLENFFTEEDVAYLRGLGANVIRLPFHWSYAEGEGVRYLDRAVAWARAQGVYLILDLHAVPGWQNPGWHSDNPYGVSLFWEEPHHQTRVIALWEALADRYRDEPAVAGYDLLNEPYAPENGPVLEFFRRLIRAVRAVDRRHLLFVEGNRYARDFRGFEALLEEDEGLVFSSHNYMPPTHEGARFPGWMEIQGERVYVDEAWVERFHLEGNRFFHERDLPCYVGEFGALYDAPYDRPSPEDLARLKALDAQMALFNRLGLHWTLWTYKDLGVQGVQVADPDSEYLRRLRPFLALKRRLGLDQWTARGRGPLSEGVRRLVSRLEREVIELFGDYTLPKRALEETLLLAAVHGHMANALNYLFARAFSDLTPEEIRDVVAGGTRIGRTRERRVLAEVLEARLTESGATAPEGGKER